MYTRTIQLNSADLGLDTDSYTVFANLWPGNFSLRLFAQDTFDIIATLDIGVSQATNLQVKDYNDPECSATPVQNNCADCLNEECCSGAGECVDDECECEPGHWWLDCSR